MMQSFLDGGMFMTDVFTDIIIRIEGWGYVLIPVFLHYYDGPFA